MEVYLYIGFAQRQYRGIASEGKGIAWEIRPLFEAFRFFHQLRQKQQCLVFSAPLLENLVEEVAFFGFFASIDFSDNRCKYSGLHPIAWFFRPPQRKK